MTLEELTRNMCKGNNKASNFYRQVREIAYAELKAHNDYIKFCQELKREYNELNIVSDFTIHIWSNKSKKLVWVTRYTKLPSYRSYRQQLGITTSQLEKELRSKLIYKNSRHKIHRPRHI